MNPTYQNCPFVSGFDFCATGIAHGYVQRNIKHKRHDLFFDSLDMIPDYIIQYNRALEERSLIVQEGYLRVHRLKSMAYLFLTILVLATIGVGLYEMHIHAVAPDWSLPLIGIGAVCFLGTLSQLPWLVCDHVHSNIANKYLGPLTLLINPIQLIIDLCCTTKETELERNNRELPESFSKIYHAWHAIDGDEAIELGRINLLPTDPIITLLRDMKDFIQAGCYRDVFSAPEHFELYPL